jgi:ribose transport system substrate-binding protein
MLGLVLGATLLSALLVGLNSSGAGAGVAGISAKKACLPAIEGCVDTKNPVVAAALKRYNAYNGSHRITKWPGPTSTPPVPKNKSLVLIPCSAAAAGCTTQAKGAAEAAKVLGWKTLTIDGQGNPKIYDQAIHQAINQHADGVFLVAIAASLAGPAIRDARKAGLAVVSFGTENVPGPTGVTWEENIHSNAAGQAIGNWLIAYTNGKGKFAVVNDPEFPSVTKYIKGVKTSLKKCSGCKIVTETSVAVTDLGTTAGPRAVAMLKANPDVQVVVAPYDPVVLAMAPAVKAAGITNVKFIGLNGDPPALAMIRKGQQQIGTVTNPFIWGGWASIDTFIRLFDKQKPVDENFPTRVFTAWDKKTIPTHGYWNGDFNFKAQFKKLWKVK